MKCRKCQHDCNDDANFCGRCGYKLSLQMQKDISDEDVRTLIKKLIKEVLEEDSHSK